VVLLRPRYDLVPEWGLLLDKLKPKIAHTAAVQKPSQPRFYPDSGRARVQISHLASSTCIYAGVMK
jgi:hypothetical protein